MENKNVLLDVVKVRTVSNHILILEFESGEERQFDMLPYLEKKPFIRLKGSPLFSKASIAHGTVVWPGNIDIAPDTLYSRSSLLHP
jgi:hypothetical protein